MLKSLLSEIVGVPQEPTEGPPSLRSFRHKCHVLVVFGGSADQRPEEQERLLTNQQVALETHGIALLRVAGGGVFSSLETIVDISADELRSELDGPSQEEFEAVLVNKAGKVTMRSKAPVSLPYVLDLIDRLA
ncbi:DUF4174 domain-containing protein [Rhizobium cauense]|uniref:DUF4174 domain-containing protein n=1 Tax=Rhizobium cauense TaxID=1166683 RepID=UPI001C6F0BA2|nr:DUF4174 domain-containing protein [Rhizobium cauense]MBW9117318.1 DUF4174 domain-containing protein [Rhizobium cauense]